MFPKFISTFKEIYNHPRNVIDQFLESEERDFSHPFLFLLIGAIVVTAVNTLLVDFSFDPVLGEFDADSEQMREIAEWIQASTVRSTTHFLPISSALILVPMLSIAGLFFFRDYITGFYSLLVMNSYAIGATMLFQMLLIPFWMFSGVSMLDPVANATLPAVAIAIPTLWIYKAYIMDSSFMAWIRIISTYIVGYVLYAVLTGFAASIIGYMIFAIQRISEMSGAL